MTPSLLCETVTGRTMAELTAARDTAVDADMVELRLDGVSDVDVPRALDGRRVPAIVTCRPTWEGGRFDGSEEERCQLLSQALAAGAEYVDIEWRALGPDVNDAQANGGFGELLRTNRARVVVSSHDFEGVPRDVCAQARAMRATGAAVVKVAVTAARLSDTLPLLDVAKDGDAVVIGMGDAGVPTRLLASRFGSRWTYGGDEVAPGQVPAFRMIHQYRFRDIGAGTKLFGVVGDNVMHSVSPIMHNAAFASASVDAVYVPLRAADFEDFVTFADALGFAGASVTIPFKLDALKASSVVDDIAKRVGAANTLRRVRGSTNAPLAAAPGPRTSYVGRVPRGGESSSPSGPAGEWESTNTDVEGFLEPLEAALGHEALRGARVSVLGAGGAARASIVALLSRDARVTVHARRSAQAKDVAAALGVAAGPWPPAARSWDVLVNCTPLGSSSAPDASPMPGGPFDGRLVYDLTYRPGESPLCREARGAGCATLDGLPMLVAQAERQFAWWTGRRPAAGVMRAAAENETRSALVS